jgi:hypothetical protein
MYIIKENGVIYTVIAWHIAEYTGNVAVTPVTIFGLHPLVVGDSLLASDGNSWRMKP